MAIRLGDLAPDFEAETTEGKINFYQWKGTDWAVLLSHPRDFTPVCTTELGGAKLKSQFEARSTTVIGLSVDSLESHDTATVRSVFVIGPDNKVKLTLTYPARTGRNFQELLRTIESLQLTARYSVATPADWLPGQDVIIVPAVSDEDTKAKFPHGFVAGKPYLRVTPQPNLPKGQTHVS